MSEGVEYEVTIYYKNGQVETFETTAERAREMGELPKWHEHVMQVKVVRRG